MINLVFALGYAKTKYDAMEKAITGYFTEFGVLSLAEVKTVIDKRLTMDNVKSLEQRA